MLTTDTSEKGLETLIVESLTGEAGYVQGSNDDCSREHVVDLAKLRAFLEATQPEMAEPRRVAPPPGSEDLEETVDEFRPLDDLSACNAQAGAAGELEDEALAGEVA